MSEDIAKLRSDYTELLGKPPFNGWGAEELQKRIDESLAGKNDGAEPAGQVEVEIKRDFWDEKGTRHRAGNTVRVSLETAMEGIENGSLARVKKGG